MAQTRLQNKFLEVKAEEFKKIIWQTKSICVSLLYISKMDYFSQLDHRILTDNSKFWKSKSSIF